MARGKSSNNRRTRATAPPRRSDGPIVPRTHLDEGESRRRLGDIFGSWLCTDWHQHDFGLDGMVEITQPLAGASDQRLNTGAKFSYQLKARSDDPATDGSFALPIDVVHLQYWLRATEFVMLVRYDIKSKRLHYRWVDDDLVGELTRKNAGWHGQSTVTIAFRASHELTQAALSTIADHASRRKRITRGHLAPGEFFRLKDALAEESKAMRAIALTLRSDSIAAGVEQVTAQLERSCYVVAVAGPSRVGKSTLLNMLVGRDVSPVDTLPTTAVPMIVVPAASEYIRVDYLDGRHEMLPFSVETVASFVAQDNNPDNGKGVKLLRLGLVNADLERGIAFLDVPGVDDLSPGIRALTIAVLSTAHAVVYVVDGSPMAEGGFALRRPDLDELTRLGGGADRLFFVVNKCDKLDQPQREKLAWYLKTQFTKYGVEKSLPTPALLLSVQESARARRGELGDDSVKQLEDAMWDFLVNSQTTGIDSLRASCGLLAGLAEDATTLLRARLITLDDVTKIKVQMVTARTGLGNLRPQMALEKQRVWTNCQRRMRESEHAILEHLRTQLEAISEEKPLPSDNDVKRFLEQRAMAAFTHEAEMLRVELQTSALLATRTLNDALGDLQEGIKRSQPVVQLPVPVITVEHLTAPASAAPLWGLGLGLIGFLAGPAEGAALALIGLFGGLFISAETLRRRKIQHLMKVARRDYDSGFGTAEARLGDWIARSIDGIKESIELRGFAFMLDLNRNLRDHDSKLSTHDAAEVKKQLASLPPRIEALATLHQQIRLVAY